MTNPIEFDPTRLIGLARRARDAKAISRAAADRAHELREKRIDLQRRLAVAEQNGRSGGYRDAAASVEQITALTRDLAALDAQMREQQSEQAELGDAAAAHGRAYKSALNFAVTNRLTIPAELSEDAREVIGAAGAMALGEATASARSAFSGLIGGR